MPLSPAVQSDNVLRRSRLTRQIFQTFVNLSPQYGMVLIAHIVATNDYVIHII